MRKNILWLATLLLVVSAGAVMGQDLVISDDDHKPTIIADLGSNSTSFSKTITLTLKNGTTGELDLLYSAGDLTDGRGNVIDRKHIQIAPIRLKKGQTSGRRDHSQQPAGIWHIHI